MRLARDTRQTLGLAIEALIELLDAVGPDPDEEPSLGNPEQMNQQHAWDINAGARDDREGEHDGAEPDVDDEPSLGSLNGINQERAWATTHGWSGMFVDGEPSLAVPEQMNQARAWVHPGNRQELEEEHDGCEPEQDCDPSLASEPPYYSEENRASIHAAHLHAKAALDALLKRLRLEPRKRLRSAN